jgi:hypothetical protein
MQQAIRVQVPVIQEKTGDYELRFVFSGCISSYAFYSSKIKSKAMAELEKALVNKSNARSTIALIRPVAIGTSKTVIQDKETLPVQWYAVFTWLNNQYEYYGLIQGVDPSDAIKNLNYSWCISRNKIILLKTRNKQILRNKFYADSVQDMTHEADPRIKTTYRLPYSLVKGIPYQRKEKELVIDETMLY